MENDKYRYTFQDSTSENLDRCFYIDPCISFFSVMVGPQTFLNPSFMQHLISIKVMYPTHCLSTPLFSISFCLINLPPTHPHYTIFLRKQLWLSLAILGTCILVPYMMLFVCLYWYSESAIFSMSLSCVYYAVLM